MKILQIVQRHYAIAGISPSNQSTTIIESINKKVFVGFLLFGYPVVAQFVYVAHDANGFIEYVECMVQTAASTIVFVCFAAIVLRKTAVFELIQNIEKLIDTRCEYRTSEAFFWKISQQVELLSEIVFISLMTIVLQLLMLPKCIASCSYYFITNSEHNSFELPVPLWFPFDSINPIGYLMAVILEYIMFSYAYYLCSCTFALGVGLYWFIISVTKEIQSILQTISEKIQSNDDHQSDELKVLFKEYIDTHGIVKQLIHDFTDIFQPMFMMCFTWSLLAISAALLDILEILEHGNAQSTMLTIVTGLIALGLVFIICELGQRLIDAFDKIDFTIDQFPWYLFPIEIQRMLPMIIANAQQPVTVECFGSTTCSREVFKNINHRAFSYFMVLRQLGD